ncbi:MAG: hypothetical protein HY796_10440 [Elusimicrobia bacterium]|nr:hypothetical protein [Elusimicrobiota bacterium]
MHETPMVVKAHFAFLLCCLVFARPARAQFYVNNFQSAPQPEKLVNFCSQGKLLVFTGSCSLPKNSRIKDSISEKACADVRAILASRLPVLYPYARVLDYRNLTGAAFAERLAQPEVLGVLGFFLIGEGDVQGGFITGPAKDRVYPAAELCTSKYDLFGGFISHSKYSPSVPAPRSLRGLVISKTELVYNSAGAVSDSWPRVCKPMISLVYPTRTFAGRMKNDALKLVAELEEQKKKQVLKVLENICKMCDTYVRIGHELAKLCPPNADVCTVKRIPPGEAKLVLDNYCAAIPAGMPPEGDEGDVLR